MRISRRRGPLDVGSVRAHAARWRTALPSRLHALEPFDHRVEIAPPLREAAASLDREPGGPR